MEELLRNAASLGDSEQVGRLLGEGVRNAPDEGGRNALHLAAAGGHKDVVATILQAQWDVNLQDSAGCTALQRAAAEGHVEVVKQLIKYGANVNIQDKVHGNTALHEASWKGYSKCVEALCQANKVNLQVKNAGGFAPLHLACQNGHNQSCRELLMANCNPDIQNNYGDTPLHTSARYGHAGVTRILISADCHMSDQNKNGDTALHITAAMGRRKLTRILLEAGCDPNKRNKQNERAKDIAIRKDLMEIIEIIDKTVPMKKKEKQKEKKGKEKDNMNNEKKRGKESGSSKDSSTRPKEKKKPKNEHQVHFETPIEAKWSPYGCHYYPDSKTFPKPKLDSLPHEPLKKGEQYYLDLAGNIRKGPVGVGYTCYCAPFFRHMEERLDRDKKELKEHINAAHVKLDKKVTSLEVKTRSQLNEITRSMALERAKCQERHLHLEQWLIRGSIFRNSEKAPTSQQPTPKIAKSKSLENILEEKPHPNNESSFHRSVDILNGPLELEKDFNDDLKIRSLSREGKESGKGSSEIGDIETSEGEEKVENETLCRLKEEDFPKVNDPERDDQKYRRTTREISERIDKILKGTENVDGMDVIYDEMLKWKSYHTALEERNRPREKTDRVATAIESNKENQRICPQKVMLHQPHSEGKRGNLQNRRSYHEILRDDHTSCSKDTDPRRQRRLSDTPMMDEPERESVQEMVSKLQKQHTVQELVAKIQKKTGLIHKSAQKWKENKLKNKEKRGNLDDKNDNTVCSNDGKSDRLDPKVPHNYENIRQWDVPQEKLSRLPYRCRDTVYSPSPNQSSYDAAEYQRNFYSLKTTDEFSENMPHYRTGSRSSNRDFQFPRNFGSEYHDGIGLRPYQSDHDLLRGDYGSAVDMGNELYGYAHSSRAVVYDQDDMRIAIDPRKIPLEPNNYSPTQNDSGYSTKPYGGSSTGPSPSLSGQDFDSRSMELKASSYLPVHLQKLLSGRTSSLV